VFVDGCFTMASRSLSTLEIGGTTIGDQPSTDKKMISTTEECAAWGQRKLMVPPPSSAAGERRSDAWRMDYLTGVANTNSAMNASDEVGGLNQPNLDEERGEQSALRSGCRAIPAISALPRCRHDTGDDCAARHDQSTTDERTAAIGGFHSLILLITGRCPYQVWVLPVRIG